MGMTSDTHIDRDLPPRIICMAKDVMAGSKGCPMSFP